MRLIHWLRSLKSLIPGGPRQAGRPANRFRPRLEALEDRCLMSAGALDPTFGSGGVVTTSLSTNTIDEAYHVAVQPDGKIIAAGDVHGSTDQIGLVRYNANGSLDTTFGTKGIVVLTNKTASHEAYDVALHPDGKIDVADGIGTFSAGSVTWNVYQFNANGTLDTSFGKRGQASVTLSSPNSSSSGSYYTYPRLVIQPPAAGSTEGKIVVDGGVAGSSSVYFGGLVGLARFNPGGSLDTTFGNKGTVETALGDGTNATIAHLSSVALQSDGKIVVSGDVGPGNPTDSNPRDFLVARYTANGSLDSSFGSGGIVTTQVAALAYENAMQALVQPSDGKIVAAGFAYSNTSGTNDWGLVRYNPDGSLDTSFGSGGIVTTAGGTARAAAIGSDGNIVVAGNSSGPFAVGRYLAQATTINGVTYAAGTLDPTFGNNGIATTSVGVAGSDSGEGIAIQPDGKIVVVGWAQVGSYNQFTVLRYLPSDPQTGSFTASPSPVTAGSSVPLTASNITDGNPKSSITQVAFYLDSNGDGTLEPGTDTLLGYATQTSPGVWTFSFTVNLAPGSYTLFAWAEDSYGVFGDPFALPLTVQ